MRRQATDWEKIFAKDTSDNELLSKTQRTLITQQENKQLDLKMSQRPKQTPHQRRTTDGK